jgi:hypothetical protein
MFLACEKCDNFLMSFRNSQKYIRENTHKSVCLETMNIIELIDWILLSVNLAVLPLYSRREQYIVYNLSKTCGDGISIWKIVSIVTGKLEIMDQFWRRTIPNKLLSACQYCLETIDYGIIILFSLSET